MRKIGLTPEQHRAIGEKLKELNETLVKINTKIGEAYRKSDPLCGQVKKLTSANTTLRGMLETKMWQEGINDPTVYFGRIAKQNSGA